MLYFDKTVSIEPGMSFVIKKLTKNSIPPNHVEFILSVNLPLQRTLQVVRMEKRQTHVVGWNLSKQYYLHVHVCQNYSTVCMKGLVKDSTWNFSTSYVSKVVKL